MTSTASTKKELFASNHILSIIFLLRCKAKAKPRRQRTASFKTRSSLNPLLLFCGSLRRNIANIRFQRTKTSTSSRVFRTSQMTPQSLNSCFFRSRFNRKLAQVVFSFLACANFSHMPSLEIEFGEPPQRPPLRTPFKP